MVFVESMEKVSNANVTKTMRNHGRDQSVNVQQILLVKTEELYWIVLVTVMLISLVISAKQKYAMEMESSIMRVKSVTVIRSGQERVFLSS